MSTNAEGGSDGIKASGPDNTYDGADAHPEVDGCTDQDIKANIRITQSWKTGEGAAPSSGFALGANRPD
jgi:hypothetical protein